MKNKTLVLITVSLILVSVIILTAGLSLLHGSADETEPTPIQSVIPLSEEADSVVDEQPETEPETSMESVQNIVFQKDLENALYYKDMVFDIYEQETGKFVGQVIVTDDELYTEYGKLFVESRQTNFGTAFDPHDENSEPVYLPKTKYRIEAHGFKLLTIREHNNVACHGGTFEIAFSYGSDECIAEFLQTGLTFYCSQDFMDAVNSIVAEEIQAIEAGTASTPEIETMDLIGYDEEDGYWDVIGRYTPRFPYLQD